MTPSASDPSADYVRADLNGVLSEQKMILARLNRGFLPRHALSGLGWLGSGDFEHADHAEAVGLAFDGADEDEARGDSGGGWRGPSDEGLIKEDGALGRGTLDAPWREDEAVGRGAVVAG